MSFECVLTILVWMHMHLCICLCVCICVCMYICMHAHALCVWSERYSTYAEVINIPPLGNFLSNILFTINYYNYTIRCSSRLLFLLLVTLHPASSWSLWEEKKHNGMKIEREWQPLPQSREEPLDFLPLHPVQVPWLSLGGNWIYKANDKYPVTAFWGTQSTKGRAILNISMAGMRVRI